MEFDRAEARWKGTTDLDSDAVTAMSLDGLAFFLVACRVEKMELSVSKQGETVRKDVLDVTDVRALLGPDRVMAVDFLSGEPILEISGARTRSAAELNDRLNGVPAEEDHHLDHDLAGDLDFVELADRIAQVLLREMGEDPRNLKVAEEIAHLVSKHHVAGPPRNDIAALKQSVRAEIFPDDAFDDEAEGVVGSLYDYKKGAPPVAAPAGGGPKVAKFQPDLDPQTAVEPIEQVAGGRKYKDSALARFMERD